MCHNNHATLITARPPARKRAHRLRVPGFTLIELVVTVAIVALLASVAMPLTHLTVQREKEQELSHSLRQIREAIDSYKQAVDEGRVIRNIDESGYPKSLEILVSGVEDAKSPNKKKIRFLRRLPRDPFADPALAPERSWGLRSYESEADDPREGKDVYDVYSRSEKIGLNGRPYRQW